MAVNEGHYFGWVGLGGKIFWVGWDELGWVGVGALFDNARILKTKLLFHEMKQQWFIKVKSRNIQSIQHARMCHAYCIGLSPGWKRM